MIPNVHAKVHVFKFLWLFHSSYFYVFGRGSRKLRTFGPRENFPLYGIMYLVILIVILMSNMCSLHVLTAPLVYGCCFFTRVDTGSSYMYVMWNFC